MGFSSIHKFKVWQAVRVSPGSDVGACMIRIERCVMDVPGPIRKWCWEWFRLLHHMKPQKEYVNMFSYIMGM